MKEKQKMPVDAVDASQLPTEAPLKYEEICRMMGHLYIQSQMQVKSSSEQAHTVVQHLKDQLGEANQHIENLTKELDRLKREDG